MLGAAGGSVPDFNEALRLSVLHTCTCELAQLGHSGLQTLQLGLQIRQCRQLRPQLGVFQLQIRPAHFVAARHHGLQGQVQLFFLRLQS